MKFPLTSELSPAASFTLRFCYSECTHTHFVANIVSSCVHLPDGIRYLLEVILHGTLCRHKLGVEELFM